MQEGSKHDSSKHEGSQHVRHISAEAGSPSGTFRLYLHREGVHAATTEAGMRSRQPRLPLVFSTPDRSVLCVKPACLVRFSEHEHATTCTHRACAHVHLPGSFYAIHCMRSSTQPLVAQCCQAQVGGRYLFVSSEARVAPGAAPWMRHCHLQVHFIHGDPLDSLVSSGAVTGLNTRGRSQHSGTLGLQCTSRSLDRRLHLMPY